MVPYVLGVGLTQSALDTVNATPVFAVAAQVRAFSQLSAVSCLSELRIWSESPSGGTVTWRGTAGLDAPVPAAVDESSSTPSVLHVVVGYRLRTYFLNAVRSVRAAAPNDHILVIDNASPDLSLRRELRRLADADDRMRLLELAENDQRGNYKIGGLYSAYELAFEEAVSLGFDMLHLVQGDCQVLWWADEFVARSAEIFEAHPRCVNIRTLAPSRDSQLTGELDEAGIDGVVGLRKYGLTDTGLYHLDRWRAHSMRFGQSESEHSSRYLAEGFEVLFHPWPTDAPIPWPAVIRGGVQRGKEVHTTRPYLLRPLSPDDVATVKKSSGLVWLEDICVPWGWVCAEPMWGTGIESIDYWVLRYRDARKNGLRHLLPRPVFSGVDRGDRHGLLRIYYYRPSVWRLFLGAPWSELRRRLRRGRRRR
jgi:hypothetical protein